MRSNSKPTVNDQKYTVNKMYADIIQVIYDHISDNSSPDEEKEVIAEDVVVESDKGDKGKEKDDDILSPPDILSPSPRINLPKVNLPPPEIARSDDKKIDTYTIEKNKQDTTNSHYFGTNDRTIVKVFKEDSYGFIHTDDFVARAEIIFNALESEYFQQQYFSQEDVSQKNKKEFKEWLAKTRKETIAYLIKECKIDIEKMKDRESEACKQHFDTQFKKAKQILAHIYVHAVDKLREYKKYNPDQLIDNIVKAEREYIYMRDRPNYIKIGPIGQHTLVSAQFPQGDHTAPSTRRDQRGLLCNYVKEVIGYINENGEFKPLSVANCHSSYPPIDIEDEYKLRLGAYEAAKYHCLTMAKDILNANPGSDLGRKSNPISINLSIMMLMSPLIVGKKVEKIARGIESEYSQVNESRLALRFLASEADEKGVIELENTNGSKIYVKLNTTVMNIPVNSMKGLTKINLQKSLNAKGFYDYCKKVEDDFRHEKLENMAGVYFTQLDRLLSNEKLKDEIALFEDEKTALEKNLKHLDKETLTTLKEIDKKINENKDIELEEGMYPVIKKVAIKANKKLEEKCKEINERKLELFNQNIDEFLKIKTSIENKIEENQTKEEKEDENKQLLLLLQFMRAQEMYYKNQYLQTGFLYELQTIYLLTNEQIDETIEFFCKSGEDRTGWQRIFMLAWHAFVLDHHKSPNLSAANEKKIFFEKYLSPARELSCSQENTKENSEAPWLQIGDKTTGFGSNKMSSQMGKLAKEVPSEAKKIISFRKNKNLLIAATIVTGVLVASMIAVLLTTPVGWAIAAAGAGTAILGVTVAGATGLTIGGILSSLSIGATMIALATSAVYAVNYVHEKNKSFVAPSPPIPVKKREKVENIVEKPILKRNRVQTFTSSRPSVLKRSVSAESIVSTQSIFLPMRIYKKTVTDLTLSTQEKATSDKDRSIHISPGNSPKKVDND